ncbi:MAG TPA: phage baseplate assembly protein [Candidatus Onthovicinus excrementipullorum]|nr:phage baseplate assembly protein [Candidatus Onthovicinus excrementipullorum]
MWLTQQLLSRGRARENERGRVTMNENGSLCVSAAVNERRVEAYAPYGYTSLPPAGSQVLLIPCAQGSVCAGVQGDPGGLSAGEVRLCSAGGARIVLKNNGEIWLNGLTITPSGEIRGYRKEE